MTNKELIQLLSGISMKSEVEVVLDKQLLSVVKVGRLHIPEKKDSQGRVTPARNIIQIVTEPKTAHE
jgi:hypothetical protein